MRLSDLFGSEGRGDRTSLFSLSRQESLPCRRDPDIQLVREEALDQAEKAGTSPWEDVKRELGR